MYLVHLRLICADANHGETTEAEAQLLHDALWARTGPASGLEHVRVRAGPNGIDLVLFLRNDIPDPNPVAYAHHLLDSTSCLSPLLIRWHAVSPNPTRDEEH